MHYAIICSTNTFTSVGKLTFEPAIWRVKISSSLATAGVKALKMALTFDTYTWDNLADLLDDDLQCHCTVQVEHYQNQRWFVEPKLLNQVFL